MIITLDEEKLLDVNLTVRQYLFLLSIFHNNENLSYFDRDDGLTLQSRGLIKLMLDRNSSKIIPILRQDGINLINKITNNKIDIISKEFIMELRSIYPKGKKQGTGQNWQDSLVSITKRMSLFFKKYGNQWSKDEILDACKRYVESFNGNYQYMQLLKYFIMKDNDSALLSELENKNNIEESGSEWNRKRL